MATIKDIARIANVSPSTVSFVLNGKAREMKVSSATEQRILEIVAATGYRPSNVARRLRASAAERPVLALYWPLDRRASYVGRLLGAFQQEHLRQELDYDLVVNTFREGHLCEEKGLHFHSPYSCAILGGLSPAAGGLWCGVYRLCQGGAAGDGIGPCQGLPQHRLFEEPFQLYGG